MPMERVDRDQALSNSEFHRRLREWLENTNEAMIGPEDVPGATSWIHVREGSAVFALNANTKRYAIEGYLQKVSVHGDDLVWTVGKTLRDSLLSSIQARKAHQRSLGSLKPMLLASTTLAVWMVDPESGDAWQIDAGRGAYYGISFDTERIYIACRQVAYGGAKEPQDNAILCLDRKLRLLEVLRAPQPIRDVHQILCDGGTLFVCSTFDDAVMEYAVASRTWNVWRPFNDDATTHDVHHINSVFVKGDLIMLAGSQPKGWFARFDRGHRPLENGKHLMGSMSHNVWLEDGEVSVCSSHEGALVSTSGTRQLIHPGAWLRGVCQVGPQRYVGISQELQRGRRSGSDCSIVAFSGEGRVDRYYTILGSGTLNDLRTIGMADTTHNGIAFELERGTIDSRFQKYETRNTLIDL